jgi:hypothetical protein
VPVFDAYIAVERAEAVAKFATPWLGSHRPPDLHTPPLIQAAHCTSLAVARWTWKSSHRMNAQGSSFALTTERPEAAVLWLTEVGHPVLPNSWEAIFARASRRCTDAGIPVRVSPHQLRHSFAVHMLAMLIQRRLAEAAAPGAMEGYRQLVGDPLQQVQRLLGHSSLATTSIYLDHRHACRYRRCGGRRAVGTVPGYLPS